jgi:hypothetical protein
VKLAISVAGGAKGERRFPLMSGGESWLILQERLVALVAVADSDFQEAEIVRTVRTAVEAANDIPEVQAKLAALLQRCCDATREKWDAANGAIRPLAVEEFFNASMRLSPPPRMPSLNTTFEKVNRVFTAAIQNAATLAVDADDVSAWTRLVNVVGKSDRRLLYQRGFPDSIEAQMHKLCELIRGEIEAEYVPDDDDNIASEAERFRTLSRSLEELVGLVSGVDSQLEEVFSEAYRWSDALDEHRRGYDEPYDPEMSSIGDRALDIDRLFSDL